MVQNEKGKSKIRGAQHALAKIRDGLAISVTGRDCIKNESVQSREMLRKKSAFGERRKPHERRNGAFFAAKGLFEFYGSRFIQAKDCPKRDAGPVHFQSSGVFRIFRC